MNISLIQPPHSLNKKEFLMFNLDAIYWYRINLKLFHGISENNNNNNSNDNLKHKKQQRNGPIKKLIKGTTTKSHCIIA